MKLYFFIAKATWLLHESTTKKMFLRMRDLIFRKYVNAGISGVYMMN
jgi:hypothetical protein